MIIYYDWSIVSSVLLHVLLFCNTKTWDLISDKRSYHWQIIQFISFKNLPDISWVWRCNIIDFSIEEVLSTVRYFSFCSAEKASWGGWVQIKEKLSPSTKSFNRWILSYKYETSTSSYPDPDIINATRFPLRSKDSIPHSFEKAEFKADIYKVSLFILNTRPHQLAEI